MEKEDPNLITVFICFLRSGLRFTRYDTNNVGLAFIEEIRKHNPNFKPVKVQQRERDQIYTVNAFPKEFEQLINSLIEEYRIKHKLEYRLKKPRGGGRGGFNRGAGAGGGRQGGYNQNRSSGGSYSPRPRRDDQGSGSYTPRPRRDDQGSGSYTPRPRRDDQGGGSYTPRPRRDDQGGYKPQGNRDGNGGQDGNSPNRYTRDQSDNREEGRPRRPRRDPNE